MTFNTFISLHSQISNFSGRCACHPWQHPRTCPWICCRRPVVIHFLGYFGISSRSGPVVFWDLVVFSSPLWGAAFNSDNLVFGQSAFWSLFLLTNCGLPLDLEIPIPQCKLGGNNLLCKIVAKKSAAQRIAR